MNRKTKLIYKYISGTAIIIVIISAIAFVCIKNSNSQASNGQPLSEFHQEIVKSWEHLAQCDSSSDAIYGDIKNHFRSLEVGTLMRRSSQNFQSLLTFKDNASCKFFSGCNYYFFYSSKDVHQNSCTFVGRYRISEDLFKNFDVIASKHDRYRDECIVYLKGFCLTEQQSFGMYMLKNRMKQIKNKFANIFSLE